ncbi:hypothetical protein FHG68_02050 [Leptospira weilii]|nr:hypothetical protein FHG67_02195 [Leptospira weilii]QDK25630.1 hypothetical protein FHG68_02050 [Leptospira weilii]
MIEPRLSLCGIGEQKSFTSRLDTFRINRRIGKNYIVIPIRVTDGLDSAIGFVRLRTCIPITASGFKSFFFR